MMVRISERKMDMAMPQGLAVAAAGRQRTALCQAGRWGGRRRRRASGEVGAAVSGGIARRPAPNHRWRGPRHRRRYKVSAAMKSFPASWSLSAAVAMAVRTRFARAAASQLCPSAMAPWTQTMPIAAIRSARPGAAHLDDARCFAPVAEQKAARECNSSK